MERRPDSAPPSTVRGRRIWIPYRKRGIVGAAVLGGGIFVAWAVVAAFFLLTGEILFDRYINQPDWYVTSSLFAGAGGAVAWVMYEARWHHRVMMAPSQGRTRRLMKLAEDARFRSRLPHRVLELQLRTFHCREYAGKDVIRRIAPGELIVVDGPRILDAPRPVACDLPFEPLDLAEDSEQLRGLIAYNAEQQGLRIVFAEDVDDDTADQIKHRESRSRLRRWASILFNLFWLVYFVQGCIRDGWTSTSQILCVSVLVIGGVALVIMMFARGWWLVPGGLIWRRHHLWRRVLKVHLFTPENTPLMLDMRARTGMVVRGDKVQSFTFHESAGWAIVAGWISTARRTTEQEALAFIGPDAVSA